jgi:hypothetical protein
MDSQDAPQIARRKMLRLSLLLTGLLLGACTPHQQPAPGSWAEQYSRRKQKYREWGDGHN